MAAPLADPVFPGHGTGRPDHPAGDGDRLARLRRICARLPEVAERPSHGAPTWFVRGKKSFLTLWEHGHHADDFPHLWCAAPPGAQAELVAAAPDRFFRPPYVGGRGWLGVRLDGRVDWNEIAELCQDAYRAVAPAKLATALDPPAGTDGPEDAPEDGPEGSVAPGG